jgi:diadenosine tetraphosphatase ApaH/serine/threonine PP2A family protein phosphatase
LAKRVAVISDIHANWHALEAVLAAIEAEAPDELWCLGDVVGYGPQPNECCEVVAARAALCLAGNHDLGVLGTLDLADFSPDAAVSASWTREVLTNESRTYLESLSPLARLDGIDLFHGSPRDAAWDYVLTFEAAQESLELTSAPLVMVGHSHVALAIRTHAGRLGGGAVDDGTEAVLDRGRWLLNPGSVGQPRDGDPRAAFVLLEPGIRATFHRVEYDIGRTQAEIRALGLPIGLAERLAHGL